MKSMTTYSCEHCGYTDTDQAKVAACEAIPMRPANVEIGDIVSTIGGGYGWWTGDDSWFHRYSEEERAEAVERYAHHAGIGRPKFVVVDIRPYGELGSNIRGEYAHRMVPILYSPSHANRGEDRIAYGWTSGEFIVHGKVSKGELVGFQKLAEKKGLPRYFMY